MHTFLTLVASSIVSIFSAIGFLLLGPANVLDKLLSHQFDRKINEIKHDYDTKIEVLKGRLSYLGDWRIRFNEREFSTISAVWGKYVDAYIATQICIIQFIEHPDLDKMTIDELTEFLDSTEFSKSQRQAVIDNQHKNTTYTRVVTHRYISKAGIEIFDARTFLRKESIFITKELKELFSKALDHLSKAQTRHWITPAAGKEDITFFEESQVIFDEVEKLVRSEMLRTMQ